MGFVFNFITYGGHQIDGVAAEEFATALKQDGMLALARLQRKMRLVESPYRTPQTLVGGPRSDAALARLLGAHGDHQGHGQGLDPAPAPRADRGAQEAAGGVAGDVGRALPARREAARAAAAAARRLGAARARHLAATATSSSPTWSSIPSRTGTAAASSRCATRTPSPRQLRQKRLMTLDPPLADAPLQGRRGVLRHARPRTTSIRPRR